LLYKTLLNIEGLGRQLYPDLNLWDTAKPFLEDWMKKQLSPAAIFEDIKRDWPQWRALLPKLPELLNQHIENTNKPPALKEPQTSTKSPLLLVGLVVAALGLFLSMLDQQLSGHNHWLLNSGPWIGVSGLLLVFIKSK